MHEGASVTSLTYFKVHILTYFIADLNASGLRLYARRLPCAARVSVVLRVDSHPGVLRVVQAAVGRLRRRTPPCLGAAACVSGSTSGWASASCP